MAKNMWHCAWSSCSKLFDKMPNLRGYDAIYCPTCASRMKRDYPTTAILLKEAN